MRLSVQISEAHFDGIYEREKANDLFRNVRGSAIGHYAVLVLLFVSSSLTSIIDAVYYHASHSLERRLGPLVKRRRVEWASSVLHRLVRICRSSYSCRSIFLCCRGRMLRRRGRQRGMLGTLLLRPSAGWTDPHGLQERGYGGEYIFP